MQNESILTDGHKVNWIRTNVRKEDTMKILFSDEKLIDIDEIYNSQNDRIWAANRAEADIKSGIVNFRKKLWFGLECVL